LEHALKAGLKVIYCFGETLEQREGNQTTQVVEKQLEAIKGVVTKWQDIVLAYEPVWAIGTGKTATVEQVAEVHSWIRGWLEKVGEETSSTRVIYGGSVNEQNCNELIKIKDVDGFLVGGASLKPAFEQIVKAKK
jgi:triosephosphate isomerase (TIM)